MKGNLQLFNKRYKHNKPSILTNTALGKMRNEDRFLLSYKRRE